MKNCPKCGAVMQDSDMFCPDCGEKFVAETPAEPVAAAAVGDMTPQQTLLRSLAGSKAFLTATMCYTVLCVLSVASSILSLIQLTALFRQLVYVMTYGTASADPSLFAVIFSASFIGRVAINVFLCAAMWSIYTWAENKCKTRPAGFTIFKELFIISLVLLSITALILVVCVALIIGAMFSNEASEDDMVFMIIGGVALSIVLVIAAVAVALAIVYYAKMIRLMKDAEDICRLGKIVPRKYTFIVVINYIMAAFSIISLLSTLVNSVIPNLIAKQTMGYDIYHGSSDLYYILMMLQNLPYRSVSLFMSLLSTVASLVFIFSITSVISKLSNSMQYTR